MSDDGSSAAEPRIVVAAVVLRRGDRVLAVRKRGTERFMLPGGKLEPGETPRECAVREIAEEIGLRIPPPVLLGRYTSETANEPGHTLQSTVFLGELSGEPRAEAEIAELRWIPLVPDAGGPPLAPMLEHRVLPALRSGRMPLSEQFRHHFGHRDHLYGELLEHLADDLDAGGVTAEICRDHLDAGRADAVQLRLLGGLQRIVLRGDAPQLVPFYPSLGGTADPSEAWPVVRPVLASYAEELRTALDHPPQTNEVGRSACLLVGLTEAVRRHGLRRIRLLEPGASAGLNLNLDRYRFTGPGWDCGPTDSPLVVEAGAEGFVPEEFDVVDRRGCDLAPVDASTDEGAAYLRSFVWPFDLDRTARLVGALEVARAHPVVVDRAPASDWIAEQLARPADPGVLTLVWTSITQQYWPAAETGAVDAAIEEARGRGPVAHVAMEGVPPTLASGGYVLDRHGPQTTLDGEVVARSHHHGPPVILTRD